jgi:hypothetical protein
MTRARMRKREWPAGAGIAAAILLFLAFAVPLSSCWDVDLSGFGTGSSGDTGGTAVGPVAGFGGVKVAGVEFVDNGAVTVVDDLGRGIDDLVEGMRISVRGTIASGFRSGTASTLTVERELRGPVDDNGVALDNNAIRVLGQTVLVTPTTVIMAFGGGEIGLEDLKRQIDDGNLPGLEVHGAVEDNGTIHATFIGKGQDNVVADDDVEIRGKIRGLDGATGTFRIGTQKVDYTGLPSGGRVDWPATGLANGLFADVRGYLDAVGGSGTVRTDRSGDRVQVLTASLGDAADRVTLEGYVLSGASSSFGISVPGGTVTVNSGAAPTGDAFGLRKKVRVEGTLSGSAGTVVQASSVAVLRRNDILLQGAPEGLPAAADTMTLLGKTVETDEFTIFRDATGAVRDDFGLANLVSGDVARVVGWFDVSVVPGKVVAARVDRIGGAPADRVNLQGPVSTPIGAPALSIIGVTVVTDFLHTDYFDKGGVQFADRDAFFQKLATLGGGTLVQVRNGMFNAGSSRIDPPTSGDKMEVEIVTIND